MTRAPHFLSQENRITRKTSRRCEPLNWRQRRRGVLRESGWDGCLSFSLPPPVSQLIPLSPICQTTHTQALFITPLQPESNSSSLHIDEAEKSRLTLWGLALFLPFHLHCFLCFSFSFSLSCHSRIIIQSLRKKPFYSPSLSDFHLLVALVWPSIRNCYGCSYCSSWMFAIWTWYLKYYLTVICDFIKKVKKG